MKRFRVVLSGAVVLFAVSAVFGMSVKSDYDKNFDFSQLRTYSFKTDRASNDPLSYEHTRGRKDPERASRATGGQWVHSSDGKSGLYCHVLFAHKTEDAS